MSTFTAVNANGAYFADQIERSDLDPFAVLGLHADLDQLSMTGVRSHFRKVVMPHVFERNGPAATQGPRVPTWTQVNQAKDQLLGGTKADFEAEKAAWSHRSVQVWNPFAAVGSPEAKLRRNDRTVPANYFAPDIEEVVDEYFANPPGTAGNSPGNGTQHNPFWFPEEDTDQTAGSTPADAGPRTPRTPQTPRMQSPPPFPNRNPPSSSRQRLKPKGIILGTWNRSGLPAGTLSNAVYGSRDRINRINRRIAKVDITGQVVTGGAYNARRTACKHEHIDYLASYRGKTKEEVDSHIQPLLDAQEKEEDSDPELPARNRANDTSPLGRAAQRRAARAQAARSGTPIRSVPMGFQVRGARFFVAPDSNVYER